MFSTPLTNATRWAQGNNWSFTEIYRQLQLFSRIWQSFDVIFCPICTSSAVCCVKGTLNGNLDIFVASGESAAWVLLWKTRSRPIGVRVCPVSQSNFSVPHLIRVWTMVMFRKEDSGTSAPADLSRKRRTRWYQLSISANFTFFDDSDVHFGPCGPLAPPGPPEPPGSPGLPLGWPLAPSPAGERERGWEREIHRVSGCIRDLDHPSLNWFQFQWVMATMISHHKNRDNGNGLDRLIEYILTRKCHKNHKCNLCLLQNLTMHQMKTWQLWIPHHHQLDHHHQLNREVAPEETKDLDRVSEYLHIWIHKIAWATVQGHHKNEKAHEDKVHKTDGQENCCRKSAECITEGKKAQVHGFRLGRWRTSKRAGNLFNLSTYCSSTSLLSKTSTKFSRTSCPWQLCGWRQWV